MNLTPKELAGEIRLTIKSAAWIYEDMSRRSQNKAQEDLIAKSGSPYQFGKSCVDCIGEISILEAQQAAEKYLKEWNNAK